MEKDDDVVTKEQAKKMVLIKENGMVHTFYNIPIGLVGGDHSKKSLFKEIDDAYLCKKTGEQAQAMGHGLVLFPKEKCTQSELLFVETKEAKKK